MEFEKIFIGLSVVVMIFAVGLLLYTDGASHYSVAVENSSFLRLSNDTINLAAKQKEMSDKITGGEVSQDNAIDNMIYGGILAVRSIVTSISTLGNMGGILSQELGNYLGYPVIVTSIVGIISFIFIVSLVYLIMRINK